MQKQYRIERLDTHLLHQMLAAAFVLEQQQVASELDRVATVRQKVNELRPRLADIAKRQPVSNLLLRRRDMFCRFLLDPNRFIAHHRP
ncbi:hypothetical protein SYNPS1DRAFT_25342 [Syncephalis pseudoplumigaleata]|uniref:Uncharacterized protein n=1 Tax=Syncephalis pseudoplumigaleata TaxID=1712513 RepID=A0A4P9YTS8_9FUNG|nr:hypothetical protein SYNPS1DRAFT_25342 [Syncephalis pseudoplumigaleata]|eukprot:RKP22782.1 hypothetical protein SYNPS1DRAFT_25342 [Syncephalis pseudoplumigaleata]